MNWDHCAMVLKVCNSGVSRPLWVGMAIFGKTGKLYNNDGTIDKIITARRRVELNFSAAVTVKVLNPGGLTGRLRNYLDPPTADLNGKYSKCERKFWGIRPTLQ